MEEIKRHHFFSTIDWNVSVSPSVKCHFVFLCRSSLTSLPPCRNSSAERSTLPSNQPQDDLMTLSISIPSSQLKHPEVPTVTPPPLLTPLSSTTLCIKKKRNRDFVEQPFFCVADSPGVPPSANAHQLFRGFSFVAITEEVTQPLPNTIVQVHPTKTHSVLSKTFI